MITYRSPGWSAPYSCITIATHFKAHAIVNAGRNMDFDSLFLDNSLSTTPFTGIDDDLSFSMTLGTSHRHAKEAALFKNLAATTALVIF